MASDIEDLTQKEKETLRLIVRGHDAKSCARELGLSVHTINERLRAARRKLDVTSSREAARLLLEHEGGADNNLGYKQLGDAPGALPPDHSSIANKSRTKALWIGGIFIMSFFAIAFALSTIAFQPGGEANEAEGAVYTSEMQEAEDAIREEAAREWLALVDEGKWQASYDAAGRIFREPNTVKTWREASEQVRVPLGEALSRTVVGIQLVASPEAYELVQFKTNFANRKDVIESVTLVRENDRLRVVGYVID